MGAFLVEGSANTKAVRCGRKGMGEERWGWEVAQGEARELGKGRTMWSS